MVQLIHDSIAAEAVSASLCVIPMVTAEHSHDEWPIRASDAPDTIHRVHAAPWSPRPWCCMVTETTHPSDPRCRSFPAKHAFQEEIDSHHGHTWDTDNPQESDTVQTQHPEAHIAPVFPAYGLKNAEDPDKEKHKWRVRAVFGGDNIRTVTGQQAVFREIASTPSIMEAARLLIFIALSMNFVIPKADCIKAYILAGPHGGRPHLREAPARVVARFVAQAIP